MAALVVLLLFAVQSFAAQTYVIRRGETLQQIATKFHTTISALQKVNYLKSPNAIRTGRVLIIPSVVPSVVPTVAPNESTTYGRSKHQALKVESDGKVIMTLPKDTKFLVLAREGDKFNIKLPGGKTGWVKADEITLEETRKPLPISDSWSLKSDIVRLAYSYRGARYRHGGTSSSGFDCSGFVKFLYATKGIKLPHDSRALYKCGKPVAKSDLQPGDLVFFAGTYRRGISHVGLYVGEGKFIHASTHRSGVRLDYLNAPYYKRHYAAAKRI